MANKILVSEEVVAQLMLLYELRYTIKQIALMTGLFRKVITRELKKHQVILRDKGSYAKIQFSSEDISCIKLFYRYGFGTIFLAKRFTCSAPTMRKLLQELAVWRGSNDTTHVLILDGKMLCRACGQEKVESAFPLSKIVKCGRASTCKSCKLLGQKINRLSTLLVEGGYELLLAQQKGQCAICPATIGRMHKGMPERLAIDHCHETGKVRGLLCAKCNRALGLLSNPTLLRKAAEYMENPPAQQG